MYLTKYAPLLCCTTYAKESFLKEITIEDFLNIEESSFISFTDGTIKRKNQIESVKNASSAQYFEYNVLPWLSDAYKKHYNELKGKCPDDIEHNILLWVLKTRYEREKYEEEVNKPMTQQEKDQRKKSIELIKRTINF